MNNIFKISVIVPVYNNEKYVERCINSIMEQTYKNIEIIIIDDGSKDNSLQICERLKSFDERIIIISTENCGVSHARNLGIEKATGDYIAFVDSDDYVNENYLQNLINETDNGQVDMVISGYTSVLKHGKISKNYDIKCGVYRKNEFLNSFVRLRKENLIQVQCNKLTKAEIVKKYRENENYISGEDYLFNLDLLKDCNIIKISECCDYMYVDNLQGVSNRIRQNYTKHYELENLLQISEIEKQKLQEIGFPSDRLQEYFEKKVFQTVKKVSRNIALYNGSHKEKEMKYKELLQNNKLRKYVNKEIKCGKQDKITLFVYKSKSMFLLKIYSNLLKLKTLMKG